MLNLSLSSLEADCLNYDIQARERLFPRVDKEVIYSDYSQQYDWEIISLQLSGFHTAKSRGWNQVRIGIPELVFLSFLPSPSFKFIGKCGIVILALIQSPTWTLPKLLGLQLVYIKKSELGLSWQHIDFRVRRHLPVGRIDEIWSQSESWGFPSLSQFMILLDLPKGFCWSQQYEPQSSIFPSRLSHSVTAGYCQWQHGRLLAIVWITGENLKVNSSFKK